MSTCLFGPTPTLGDILVIMAYTQKPRENVDADIHVSSGDIEVSILPLFIIYMHTLP